MTTDDEPGAVIERALDEAYTAFESERYDRAGELLAGVAAVVAPEFATPLWFDAARFARDGYGLEILKSGVDRCSCCSEGTHQSERGRFDGEQPLFVAAPQDTALAILGGWTQDRPHARSWVDLHRAGNPAAALIRSSATYLIDLRPQPGQAWSR
jgi:hypothetical protein